jgi:hypothetical protein
MSDGPFTKKAEQAANEYTRHDDSDRSYDFAPAVGVCHAIELMFERGFVN